MSILTRTCASACLGWLKGTSPRSLPVVGHSSQRSDEWEEDHLLKEVSIDQSDTHRYPCFLLSDPSSCIAIVVDLKRFLTRSWCSYTTDKPINLLKKILFNYPKTNRSVMKTYEKCFRPLRFMEPHKYRYAYHNNNNNKPIR